MIQIAQRQIRRQNCRFEIIEDFLQLAISLIKTKNKTNNFRFFVIQNSISHPISFTSLRISKKSHIKAMSGSLPLTTPEVIYSSISPKLTTKWSFL